MNEYRVSGEDIAFDSLNLYNELCMEFVMRNDFFLYGYTKTVIKEYLNWIQIVRRPYRNVNNSNGQYNSSACLLHMLPLNLLAIRTKPHVVPYKNVDV